MYNVSPIAPSTCAENRVKMADSETETNPRKKIKIDHHPDQNGMSY